MLESKKSAWFENLFAVYNRNLIRRRFESLNVAGIENRRDLNPQFPLIVYANHSSFWDGLIAFEIFRAAGLNAFYLMEEKQLKNLSLFRRLGAFSIVRENLREAVKSINYAARLLTETKGTLLIFPQGEILPNDVRPLFFYHGLSRIIEKIGKVYAAPLAMRYEFLGEFKPQIFVSFGKCELIETGKDFNPKEKTNIFAEHLTADLDKLKFDITSNNFNSFKKII